MGTFPSAYEEHVGECWDPTLHSQEIEQAIALLNDFLSSMRANQIPDSSVDGLRAAVEVLGKYAGYPVDMFYVDDHLASPKGADYRSLSAMLQGYVDDMRLLIERRSEDSSKKRCLSSSQPNLGKRVADEDLPF